MSAPFGRPEYLNLLWLLPVLLLFLIWGARRKRQMAARFCGEALLPRLVGPHFARTQRRRVIVTVLAVLFCVLALTQPRWGYQWKEQRQLGLDLVVALDVSNSMLAEDIKPNRLDRARRKILDLLDMLEGDRIGLVVFAGDAFVQCPLTLDYTAAKLFLSAVDTDILSIQGTALDKAIRVSVEAMSGQAKKSKAVILITDGEDHQGDPVQAARWAAEQGVQIYTIGIGRELGAPIPSGEPGGGFKKDANGEVILTKLDEATLQAMALETGGTYVRSVTGDLDLTRIYKDSILVNLEKKQLKSQRRKQWHERFQWMIFLALVCLLADFWIDEKSRPAAQRTATVAPGEPDLLK